MREPDVELRVRLLGIDVGVAAAQPAAVEHINAKPCAVPEVGRAGRAGHNLGVIGVDEMRLDVLELSQAAEIGERRRVIEQILVRHHVGGSLLGHGKIAIGLEIAACELCFQLDAFIIGPRVIERAEDQRLPEISVVDQVGRELVVGVYAELESAAVAVAPREAGSNMSGASSLHRTGIFCNTPASK